MLRNKHGKKQQQSQSSASDILNIAKPPVEETEDTHEIPESGPKAPTPAEAPKAEATPAISLADLVRNAAGLSDEQRAKLLGDALKIEESEAKSLGAKAMVEFNKELEATLPKFFEELRKKHGVNLDDRRITIYFPKDGEDKAPKLTSSAKGNRGTRDSFPKDWGEAIVVGVDGKETKHKSPTKAAESLGLHVYGHTNMPDVFLNPTKSGDPKVKLPKIYEVDSFDDRANGNKLSRFRITILKEPKS